MELDVVEGLHAAGVSTQLKVMYVPDYVPLQARTLAVQTLSRALGQLLPGYELNIAIAEGPFKDEDGVGAHFEAKALQVGKPAKEGKKPQQISSLIVDLHVSVVKLARAVALHKPSLVVGEGQGGVVAAAFAHPGCLETVLSSRNVQ